MAECDYMTLDGALICSIPDENCLDWDEINQIVEHTVNTWQQNRGNEETLRNTVQGKKAEFALERYLEYQTRVRYVSYDKFRTDDFEKHAPFDGLIYSVDIDENVLKTSINEINVEVSRNATGQISESLRERLEAYRIFTLEIKSSQLREKDYYQVENRVPPRTEQDYKQIIANLRKWDYFVYPHYTRRSNTISSFYDYAEFVRGQDEYRNQSNQIFLRNLILKEFRNASDIYTRLYFDYQSNEIIIPGYMIKEGFYHNPKIGKMPGGKSGMALYYMRGISQGTTFLEIDNDEAIWNYDRLLTYAKLFAYEKKKCPTCGSDLQICNARARHVYSYHCYECDSWFSMDQINGD